MVSRLPVVAIIGRTNVGKSTLFNALSRRRLAVVEDQPGVTRDRNCVRVSRSGVSFTLVDTGGLVGEEGDTPQAILESVRAQAKSAIAESALVLAVLDGLAGPHPLDHDVADALRKSGRDIVWVVNKCEKPLTEVTAAEFYGLGIGEFVCLSAAHRLGIGELEKIIVDRLLEARSGVRIAEPEPDKSIKVAVVGKPNVGKSTLINRILGEERLITSASPGTTRDTIDTELVRDGQPYVLIDTAGLRKKARVPRASVERYTNLRTLRALARCDVAVLMIDATQGAPGDQEKKIAELVNNRGKGLVLVVNKWDAVEKDHRTVKSFKDEIFAVLPFVRYAPVVFTSALSGRRCPSVLDAVRRVYAASHSRIQTAELNRVAQRAFQRRPPPVYHGEPVKLFFATQTDVAPPTMVLFVNHPRSLGDSYLRYLKTQIRHEFPLEGTDIKLLIRKRTSRHQGEAEE